MPRAKGRLPRPYIPLAIRVQVAERQMKELTGCVCTDEFGVPNELAGVSLSARLKAALFHLSSGGDNKLDLHHRPALVNRKRKKNGDYDPPANSPDHLVYLPKDVHDIETRVRGQHGQHSDLALARKLKNIARNRDPKRKKIKIKSASRWPKGRKLQSKSSFR